MASMMQSTMKMTICTILFLNYVLGSRTAGYPGYVQPIQSRPEPPSLPQRMPPPLPPPKSVPPPLLPTRTRIPVDSKGIPKDPLQENCRTLSTIGPFDLLNVQMDIKQILSVIQHILCDYQLSRTQFHQLRECFEIAVSQK